MTRLDWEQHQVWIYLAAMGCGLGLGLLCPHLTRVMEAALWPTLATLLLATFIQVPMLEIGIAWRDRRFLLAVVLGNFVLLPAAVWGGVCLLSIGPDLRFGILLVLLVPCTDWFITFCQLGKGDAARAIAISPLLLVLQLLLLPVYLWLMAAGVPGDFLASAALWPAVLIILVPLIIAALVERPLNARPRLRAVVARFPVPLLALVIILIAGAQAQAVLGAGYLLPLLVPVFVGFLILALMIAWGLSWLLRLPPDQARCLAFSCGTRNSFVVLPLALALPKGWEVVALVLVLQPLVELFGMIAYLHVVPRWLWPVSQRS